MVFVCQWDSRVDVDLIESVPPQLLAECMKDPDLQWNSDLAEREEFLVVALGYIHHQVLCAFWEFSWEQTWEEEEQEQEEGTDMGENQTANSTGEKSNGWFFAHLDILKRLWKVGLLSLEEVQCCLGSYNSLLGHNAGPADDTKQKNNWCTISLTLVLS